MLTVFSRLNQFHFTVHLKKCEFGETEVTYLGHLLTAKHNAAPPAHVLAIQEFEMFRETTCRREFRRCTTSRQSQVKESGREDKFQKISSDDLLMQYYLRSLPQYPRDTSRSTRRYPNVRNSNFRTQRDDQFQEAQKQD